jgi:hypothetical protein
MTPASIKQAPKFLNSNTKTLTLTIENAQLKPTLTLCIMHVILVIVGPTRLHLTALDDLNRMVFAVSPTAQNASAYLER